MFIIAYNNNFKLLMMVDPILLDYNIAIGYINCGYSFFSSINIWLSKYTPNNIQKEYHIPQY